MTLLQRPSMTRTRSAGIAALLLAVLLMPLVSSADSTVTINTTWSGSMTLSGNVTVASGATLTVEPGTEVDAGPYGIIVEGVLEADQALFYSSVIPETQGSHGQGLWPGIVIEAGGIGALTEVTIANASAGVLVKGQLSGSGLVFNDAYRGVSVVGGTANITDTEAHRMDYEAFYVQSGTLHLSNVLASEVAIGLANYGVANISDFTVQEAGVGVQSMGGTLELTGFGLVNASVGFATVSGASSNVQSAIGQGLALAVDAGDATDLQLSNAVLSGGRLVVGQGVSAMMFDDVEFLSTSSSEMRPAVDVSCDGTCTISSSSINMAPVGMAWSGSGTSVLEHTSVNALYQGVEATGSGHSAWSNLSVSASSTGISVQTPTSSLEDVEVVLTSSDATGVDVLGGQHRWTSVNVEKPFLASDRSSIGLRAWYADLMLDQFRSRNTSTGMLFEDSIVQVTTAEANIGATAGLHLIDSVYRGDSLTTVAQDEGVLMQGAVSLHLQSWTAQLHDTPLMMSSGSEAVVRSFAPLNTAQSSSDALGDGTLYYGSSNNPTVSTTASYRLLETAVTFTDLQSNPVEADVDVHGFTLRSNSNGALTLPLVASGSWVDVTLEGSGVRVMLYGGQSGQSVQVPVIPQGDWTVNSGQDIVLGPRPDGQPHQLSGDLVVSNNARLTLKNTALNLLSGQSVTLQGTGVLQGEDATLTSPWVQATGQSMLTGIPGATLTIQGDVQWGCLSPREVEGLVVNGNLTVQPSCEIELINGSINGRITAQTGATFTSSSSLSIQVLDKGQPVEGALISIEGSVGMTDAAGRLTTSTVSRSVTDVGETWTGIKTVTLQRNNFSDFVTWDTNGSLAHTFMASTLPSGVLSQWLVLERQWSPYTLDGDLSVQNGATLTVRDGVSLRMSEGVAITVNGALDAGSATLSSTGFGARWGGLVLGTSSSSMIELTGTHLVEASPALTVNGFGEVHADGVFVARSASDPLIVIETGSQADVTIRNSRLQDSGNGCVNAYPSSGLLAFTNVSFASCDGAALWGQQVPLDLSNLVLEDGVDQGLDLTGVVGRVEGIDATAFSGEGAIVSLNAIRGGFEISGIEGLVGAAGGIVGEDNEDLVIQDVHLTGAPAIDLDLSSGLIADVVLQGSGGGTAVTAHHGRSSESLVFDNLTVADYSVAISLHSDVGELSSPLIVRDSQISGTSALATEHHPARFEDTTLVGEVEISATEVVVVDGLVAGVTPEDDATLVLYRTVALEARRDGAPVSAMFTVTYSDETVDPVTAAGTTVDVELLLRTVSENLDAVMGQWTVVAVVEGSPQAMVEITSPTVAPDVIVVNVQSNQPPTVHLIEPYPGQRVMEGDSIRASATFSDDLDAPEDIVLSWKVYDMQGNTVLQGGNEPMYNITDLGAGFYVVEVTATDSLGKSASASTDFEYTQLDTDGDWTSSCSSDTWFDATTGKSCGPNIYDEDDDNDGFSDAKDAFPLDPCAQVDTDGDTQPDVLDCPPGYTSWLTEDMDDDGDGVPDVLEGVSNDDTEMNLNALLVVLTLLVVVVLLFFVRLRRGGPGDLTGLDQRHL